MMMLKELFDRNDVPFPEWLENEPLKGDWENSNYFKGENIHKWELNTPIGFQTIVLEDELCTFTGYDSNNQLIFEKIDTPDTQIIS